MTQLNAVSYRKEFSRAVPAHIRVQLKQLGLSALFGVKEHPLPWLTAQLNGVEHANFFETRATEYAKAATGGAWHGAEGAWGLFDRRVSRRQLELLVSSATS